MNRAGDSRLTLRELKRGNLIAAMQHADEEEDINKVLRYVNFYPHIMVFKMYTNIFFLFRYFSYEHFYVIYCKFWELDTDHDFLIDKENLIRYGNHALTYRIVDRIFSQVCNMNIIDFCFLKKKCLFFKCLNKLIISYCFLWFRYQESLRVMLKGEWDMKILFISFCPKRINRQSLVWSTGMFELTNNLYV